MNVRELLKVLADVTLENDNIMDYKIVLITDNATMPSFLGEVDELEVEGERFVVLCGEKHGSND